MAAATVTSKVKVKRIGNNYARLVVHAQSNLNQLAYNTARVMAASARAQAPVRTGYLKDSIVRERLGPGFHKIKVGAPYGVYVEYGTRYMRAQPYFHPAIVEAKAYWKAKIRQGGFFKP